MRFLSDCHQIKSISWELFHQFEAILPLYICARIDYRSIKSAQQFAQIEPFLECPQNMLMSILIDNAVYENEVDLLTRRLLTVE
jgi:hypothetical protein